MLRARLNRGGTWAGLMVGLAFGFLLAAAAMAAFLWFVNGAVSTGGETYLKKYFFDTPEASFGTFRADVFHGRFVLTDLQLKSDRLSLTVPEITADLPLSDFIAGNGRIRSLLLKKPLVEGVFSLRNIEGEGNGGFLHVPRWIRRLPVAEVSVTDGQIRLTNRDTNGALGLRKMNGRLLHEMGDGGSCRLMVDGQNESAASGQFALDATIESVDPALRFNGDATLRQWPLESLALFVSANSDVRITDGHLNVKTQVVCKDDWITASHLVEITDFKLDVSSQRKELFGLPVKKFKEMLNIPSLSFVVPMNGSLHDPQVGIASSVQQILYKMLEGKIENKKDLEKWSRRGGAYFGAKIDAALRSEFGKK